MRLLAPLAWILLMCKRLIVSCRLHCVQILVSCQRRVHCSSSVFVAFSSSSPLSSSLVFFLCPMFPGILLSAVLCIPSVFPLSRLSPRTTPSRVPVFIPSSLRSCVFHSRPLPESASFLWLVQLSLPPGFPCFCRNVSAELRRRSQHSFHWYCGQDAPGSHGQHISNIWPWPVVQISGVPGLV